MYCHIVPIIFIIFFFGITTARDLTGWKISKNYESVELNYKNLISNILEKDFRGSQATVVEISDDCPSCNMVLSTLMENLKQSFFIVNKPDFTNVLRMKDNESFYVYNNSGYSFVIILINDFDELFHHFENLRQQYDWNPRAKHLIVTVAEPSGKKLQLFFEECWKHRILNVGVSIYNSQEVYTYNHYLSNFPYEKVDASNLFYDKLQDMMGYPIRVKYIPLIDKNIAKWIPEEKRFEFFDTDWSYSQIFFRSVNATPEYLNLTNEDVRRFSNFTYRLSHWRHREFGRGELWLNAIAANYKFQERFEKLYPLALDGAYIVSPKSSLKLLSVFNPCDDLTWMLVGLSFMVFNLYIYALYKYKNVIGDTFLTSYGIFFAQYFPKIHNLRPVEKCTFLSWTIFGALLLAAHQGMLYSALTAAFYNPEVDDITGVSRRTRTMYTYEDLHEIVAAGHVPLKMEVIFLGTVDYYEYMQTHRNCFYTFLWTSAEFVVKRPKLQSENGVPFFHIMKECLLPMYLTYFVPYGSPYLDKMNRAVRISKEAGLDQYWETELNLAALLSGKIISSEPKFKVPKPLSIWTQILPFFILIGGLLVSFFCCVYEVYKEKLKTKLVIADFVTRKIYKIKNVQ